MIVALLDERTRDMDKHSQRINALESKVDKLNNSLTCINAGAKAWMTACAIVGGIAGWIMNVLSSQYNNK